MNFSDIAKHFPSDCVRDFLEIKNPEVSQLSNVDGSAFLAFWLVNEDLKKLQNIVSETSLELWKGGRMCYQPKETTLPGCFQIFVSKEILQAIDE